MIIAQGVTSNGVRYTIHDDCAAPKGSAEEAQIIQEQRRIAYKIMCREAEERGGIGHKVAR